MFLKQIEESEKDLLTLTTCAGWDKQSVLATLASAVPYEMAL